MQPRGGGGRTWAWLGGRCDRHRRPTPGSPSAVSSSLAKGDSEHAELFVLFSLSLSFFCCRSWTRQGQVPVPRCMRKPVFSSPARYDEKANTKQRVLRSRAVAAIAVVVDLLGWLFCLFCTMVCFSCVCVLAVSGARCCSHECRSVLTTLRWWAPFLLACLGELDTRRSDLPPNRHAVRPAPRTLGNGLQVVTRAFPTYSHS